MNSDRLAREYLPVLIERRDGAEAEMAQYLAGRQGHCPEEEDKDAAHRLFDVLLDGMEGRTAAMPLDSPSVRSRASRFGDGLSPVLRDVLGPDLPEAFVARCVDRYWASLQAAAA